MTSTSESHCRAGHSPAPILFAVAAVLAAFLPAALHAQNAGQPARAVRLSYVDGKVTLSQNNQVITDQAVANTPLLDGMTVATADDGRAEIQFEDGSVARVAPDGSLTLKVLRGSGPSGDAEMDVNSGLAYFELQDNGQVGPIRVAFGDSVVTGSGFTILRVKNDTPPGEIAVFSGNAHLVRSSGLAVEIHGGEDLTLSASDPNGYNLAETIPPDSWDQWNSDRDQALNAELADQSNAPSGLAQDEGNNPAWGDLDANGTWYNVPDQGYVWSPYDASSADFDPYGNGNWVDTPGFGYTWVSAYPWGYLPYQCGAWNFYNGFGWGWAPGMGGCMPWWGVGFYRGPNIGFAPGWYRPVHRPGWPHGERPGHPMPMVPVHRQPMVLSVGLPQRDRNVPVNINGRDVMALRTTSARPAYESAMFGSHSGDSAAAQLRAMPSDRQTYVATRPAYRPTRQAVTSSPRSYSPQYTYSPPSRGSSQPARSYSAPSHTSGGSSHSSGGGGGYHGGGGGGGGHSGGGGGGGHSGGGGGGRR